MVASGMTIPSYVQMNFRRIYLPRANLRKNVYSCLTCDRVLLGCMEKGWQSHR